MEAEVVGIVDIGKNNSKNDDRLMIGKKIIDKGLHKLRYSLPFHCAVCDGVGGNVGGDKAAEYVLGKLVDKNLDLISGKEEMLSNLCEVNIGLLNLQEENKIANGMKTTIVGISIYDNQVIYYNSGDSRLYRLRGGFLCKLSEDHSIAQEMINKGIITDDFEEELMKCSHITRCLGEKDVLPPYVEIIEISPICEDLYLLCSDGLWGVVNDRKIGDILRQEGTLEQKLDNLHMSAIEGGSEDNISIAIIRICD